MPDTRTAQHPPTLVVEHHHTDPWLHRYGSPSMSWCIVREVETHDAGEDDAGGELETVIHAWLGRAKGHGSEWVARISGPYHDVVRSTERLFRGEERGAAVAMAVGETPASVTLAAAVDPADLHLLVRRAWHHRLTLALIRVRGASGSEVVAALDRGDDGQALAWADRVLVCQSSVRRCSLGASDPTALEGLPARRPAYSLVPVVAPPAPTPVEEAPLKRSRLPGLRVRVGLSLGLVAAGAAIIGFSGVLAPGSSSGSAAAVTSHPTGTSSPTSTAARQPTGFPASLPAPVSTPAIPASVQLASFPSPRTGEAVAFDAGHDSAVLFGGRGGSTSVLGDTWLFSGGTWTQARSASGPQPRTGAAMTYNPQTGHVVLVGGTSASGAGLDDTWVWDGAAWSQVSVRARAAAGPPVALAFDGTRGSLLLLTRAPGSAAGARTWTFAGGAWKQQPLSAATTAHPGSALVDDPALGRLLLVDVAAGTTRAWTGTAWNEIAGAGTPVGTSASAAFDPTARQAVMVVSAEGRPLTTWTFGGDGWRQAAVSAGPANVGALTATTSQVVAFGGLSAADDLSQAWRWSASGWGG